MDRSQAMLNQSVGKLLWSFSWPAMVAMMVNSLYNVVDRIFVGRGVGSDAIAGITVGFPVMVILMALSILIGVGATALISIRLGQGNMRGAERVVGNAVVMLVVLPAVCAITYLFYHDQILVAFGASPEVLPYARDFMNTIMMGAVIGSMSMGMNNFIRAEGNPRLAMYTQLVAVAINLVLNYIFIFQLGWGVKGSALSTVIAWSVSTIWIWSYYLTGRSLVKIKWENLKPNWTILSSIMAIGLASFSLQIANSVQQIILNRTVMFYGGDISLAAVGILMSIATLLIMPILGLSQGTQPIVGFNYGAEQYGRVRKTLKLSMIGATLISIVGWMAVQIWPEIIVGLFSRGNAELTRIGAHALKVYFAAAPVIGLNIIASAGFFQAVGKAKEALALSLTRHVLLFIPILLILPRYFQLEGVWMTAPAADVMATMVVISFLIVALQKMPKENKLPDGQADQPDINR